MSAFTMKDVFKLNKLKHPFLKFKKCYFSRELNLIHMTEENKEVLIKYFDD